MNMSGIFRFNFWQFGRWVEVLVDDRLPTTNDTVTGGFLYAYNMLQPNEFWVPLIEKAYAKYANSFLRQQGGCYVIVLSFCLCVIL